MVRALLAIALSAFIAATWGQKIDIQLSARSLASGDLVWGPPDPYVKVSYAVGSNAYTLVGTTETLHTKDPQWSKIFEFFYVEHLEQTVKFEIMEADALFDDRYGTVTIAMSELLNNNGLERDFGKGILIIKNTA